MSGDVPCLRPTRRASWPFETPGRKYLDAHPRSFVSRAWDYDASCQVSAPSPPPSIPQLRYPQTWQSQGMTLASLLNGDLRLAVFIAIGYSFAKNEYGHWIMSELGISYLWTNNFLVRDSDVFSGERQRSDDTTSLDSSSIIPDTYHFTVGRPATEYEPFLFGRSTKPLPSANALREVLCLALRCTDSVTKQRIPCVIVSDDTTRMLIDMKEFLGFDILRETPLLTSHVDIQQLSRGAYSRTLGAAEILACAKCPLITFQHNPSGDFALYSRSEPFTANFSPRLPTHNNAGNGAHYTMLAMMAMAFHYKSYWKGWPPHNPKDPASEVYRPAHLILEGLKWVVQTPLREYPLAKRRPPDYLDGYFFMFCGELILHAERPTHDMRDFAHYRRAEFPFS